MTSGNRVSITETELVVEPLGLDKVWSFTRRIRVPLTAVTGASFDPTAIDEPKGLRFPGLNLPSKAAGTFYSNGKRQFWNISGHDGAIVMELDGTERFDRLILTVEDPVGEVEAINQAREGQSR